MQVIRFLSAAISWRERQRSAAEAPDEQWKDPHVDVDMVKNATALCSSAVRVLAQRYIMLRVAARLRLGRRKSATEPANPEI